MLVQKKKTPVNKKNLKSKRVRRNGDGTEGESKFRAGKKKRGKNAPVSRIMYLLSI